jgi:hypothetical protein
MTDKCVWPKSSLILFGNIFFSFLNILSGKTRTFVLHVSKMWITISLPSVGSVGRPNTTGVSQGVDKLCITKVLITYIMLNGMGCITNHCITYIKDYYI